MDNNQTRRQLLTNVAKTVPLAAVAVATGSARPVSAAPKGGSTPTALVNVPAIAGGANGLIGTLTLTSVQVVNGVLTGTASFTGNIVDAAGNVLQSGTAAITAIPLQAAASCEILNLVLGPLDLNLLGLTVHLNQVVLNITAVPGAGNLLGNLLCAVADLLNGGGPLATLLNNLANLLNQILGAL